MAWTFVSGILVLAVAAFGARPIGRALRNRPRPWYLAASAAVFVVAVGLFASSAMPQSAGTPVADALQGVALGLGFGGVAGLRYGYKGLFEVAGGKSVS